VSPADTCDPEIAFDPVHPLEAVQPVAFVELQLRFVVFPEFTVVGEAISVTVGAGDVTVTV
jgi:hypothetical protein